MHIALTKEEAALVLDALAAMPLQRSYNLFNRLLNEVNKPDAPVEPTPPCIDRPPLPGEQV
jgi:hypothetical protein